MKFNVKNVNIDKVNSNLTETWVYDADWNVNDPEPIKVTYRHMGMGDKAMCVTNGELDLRKVFARMVSKVENLFINDEEITDPRKIAYLPACSELDEIEILITRTAVRIVTNGYLNEDEVKNL